MKHLIVGAGVMGQKYANILITLGDEVVFYDPFIFDQPYSLKHKIRTFGGESVLICTYPELHLQQLKDVSEDGFPCFIEKPIITPNYDKNLLQNILERNRAITMVSCNWRFCPCIDFNTFCNLDLYYKSRDVYPEMDLIHFIDMFWHDIDKDNFNLKLDIEEGLYLFDSSFFNINLHTKAQRIKSLQSGVPFHTKYCTMFVKQMQVWREVVSKRISSPNPVTEAVEKAIWLIDKIKEKENAKF